MFRITAIAGLSAALAAPADLAAAEDWLWWEAEDATAHNFDPDHPFAPQHEVLSGGEWIGIAGERDEVTYAEYEVEVPADGAYKFYVRKFWKHGPFRYRFGDGEWHEIGRDVSLLDSTFIRKHLGANWIHAGDHELAHRGVGWIPEDRRIFTQLTVEENRTGFYVYQAPSDGDEPGATHLGSPLDLHSTASGKALLAVTMLFYAMYTRPITHLRPLLRCEFLRPVPDCCQLQRSRAQSSAG